MPPVRPSRWWIPPVGRLGLTVCYDLRFPELYSALRAAGAELISAPSAFTVPTGQAHWELLLRARAVETHSYLLGAAQGGVHANGRTTWGHAMAVDPWGEVLAVQASGEAVLLIERDAAAPGPIAQRLRHPAPPLLRAPGRTAMTAIGLCIRAPRLPRVG